MYIISTIGIVLFIVLFVASAWCNVFLMRKMLHFSENIDNLLSVLIDYQKHIEKINSMETYYGDKIIQDLVDHTSSVSVDIQDFVDGYEGAFNRAEENAQKAE